MLLNSLEKVLLCPVFRSNPVILLPNMMAVTPWCSQGRGEIYDLQGPKEQGVIFKAKFSEERGYGDFFFSGTVPVHREAPEVSPYLSPMAFLGHLCSASCIPLVQHSPNGDPEGTNKSLTLSSRAKTLPRFLSTSR